jgi:hypothetical protein
MFGQLTLSLTFTGSLVNAQWSLANTLSQEQTNGGSILGTLEVPALPPFLDDAVSIPSHLQQTDTNLW